MSRIGVALLKQTAYMQKSKPPAILAVYCECVGGEMHLHQPTMYRLLNHEVTRQCLMEIRSHRSRPNRAQASPKQPFHSLGSSSRGDICPNKKLAPALFRTD